MRVTLRGVVLVCAWLAVGGSLLLSFALFLGFGTLRSIYGQKSSFDLYSSILFRVCGGPFVLGLLAGSYLFLTSDYFPWQLRKGEIDDETLAMLDSFEHRFELRPGESCIPVKQSQTLRERGPED